METLNSIGARLRKVREDMGRSQTEFAEIAKRAGVPGATRQSQAKYEKGLQTPGAAYLTAIQSAGADVNYVLTGIKQDAQERLDAMERGTRRASDAGVNTFEGLHAAASKAAVEASLVASWRRCSPGDQHALMQIVSSLAKPTAAVVTSAKSKARKEKQP